MTCMNIFQSLSIPKKIASLLQQIWIQCISHIPWNVPLFLCTLNRSRWSFERSLCETAVMRYQRPWLWLYSDLHQSTIFEARAGATSCLQASLCTNITIVARSHDDLTHPFWVCLPHAPTKCWKDTFLKYLDIIFPCLIHFRPIRISKNI